jgi:uncharacterized membrane protein YwzB
LKQTLAKINWTSVARFLFVITLALAPVFIFAATADAALPQPKKGDLCTQVGGGQALNCDNDTDLNDLIIKIINWILAITLAVDVLFMIIGGFLYITSAGNEDRAKKGRTTVVNAVIGLVIIVLAYVIANVVANFFQKSA